MSNSANPITANDVVVRFSSLAALREAHSKLLKHYRKSPDAPELLDEVEKFIYQGQSTGTILDTDDERRTSQSLLDYWSTVLYRAGRESPDPTLAEFKLAPELDDADCPYPGLAAFRETNSNLFFGRQQLIKDLLNHLKEKRLLVVVGPAGSGKVSLVLAGLLPALKKGALPGSKDWRYYPPMVPGADPLKSLAQLIQPAGTNTAEWIQCQVKGFRQNPKHLVELISKLSDSPVVLVVNRLREVFLLCQDDDARRAFVDNLLHLSQTPQARHTVIFTLQSNFERSLEKEALDSHFEKDDFKEAEVQVPSLDASEVRVMIEKPAERVGLKLDKRVVEELIKETLKEPVGLPLLQFTLWKLWENRKRNRITWESYERLGGVRQVLVNCADAFYEGLSHEEQLTARNILLRMVRGEVSGLARRQVPKSELVYSDLAENHRVENLIKRLSDAHLIVEVRETEGDEPYVELAHDALVQEWNKLRTWAGGSAQASEDQLLRGRLRATVKQWKENKKDKKFLWYDDPGLDQLKEVLKSNDNWLNKLETEFVLNSEDRKQRRNDLKLIFSLVCLGLAVLVSVVFINQKNSANQATNKAKLATTLQRQLNDYQGTAAYSVTYSPCGRQLAWASDSGLKLLTIATRYQQLLSEDKAYSVAFSPDGRSLASASDSGISLWDIANKEQQPLSKDKTVAQSVAFSPDGRSLASASDSGISLWDIVNKEQQPLSKDKTALSVAFSPDGGSLASTSRDGSVKLWDIANKRNIANKKQQLLSKHKTAAQSIAFSPDGTGLAWASGNSIIIWNVMKHQQQHVLKLEKTTVSNVTFSPDGTSLASTSRDGFVRLWNVATGKPEILLEDKTASSIAFSPDGRTLASATETSAVEFPIVNTEKTVSVNREKCRVVP